MRARLAGTVLLVFVAACGGDDSDSSDGVLGLAVGACVAASEAERDACSRQCTRFSETARADRCGNECESIHQDEIMACVAIADESAADCRGSSRCAEDLASCRERVATTADDCSAACESLQVRCLDECDRERASGEQSCGFFAVQVDDGTVELPSLDAGRAADLSSLLDEAELRVVEAADANADGLRRRALRLWLGAPGVEVRITQVAHEFPFGFPIDYREFRDRPDDLEFYRGIARRNANLMVAETSLKWRKSEPEPGIFDFECAESELAIADEEGFDVKAHVLLWGNAPPFASGSGIPDWLRERFPETELSAAERDELRELIRRRIEHVVGIYAGRIDVWEVTNEMLNPFTSWFVDRLGPGIVDDVFAWTRGADPGVELVYNEWIDEVFTGLPGPSAADVRDRVVDLLSAGAPVDVLGVQGHFAPGIINVGGEADLSERTRIDDYLTALDTLADAGLPIHITEVTVAAPDEPEHRAAQTEALLRVWWGHPAVEQVIFWSLWTRLGPRSHLDLGVYGDDGQPTRHGEAVLSLINDRWRTRASVETGEDGAASLRVTRGDYVAEWRHGESRRHARFRVGGGPGTLTVAVAGAAD